ncbi:hypothetical protein AB7849_17735 [Rhodanobacter sp. 115]|uniref:hypothetical protein n=1 Tax=Rhodanobacter sp. FW021-MT20 TaxID=1162282 RepID=UPI0034E57064
MGLSPLDGLPMVTRPGSLDPDLMLLPPRQRKISATDVERMMGWENGLVGVSGRSGDTRLLLGASDAASRLAVNTMCGTGSSRCHLHGDSLSRGTSTQGLSKDP